MWGWRHRWHRFRRWKCLSLESDCLPCYQQWRWSTFEDFVSDRFLPWWRMVRLTAFLLLALYNSSSLLLIVSDLSYILFELYLLRVALLYCCLLCFAADISNLREQYFGFLARLVGQDHSIAVFYHIIITASYYGFRVGISVASFKRTSWQGKGLTSWWGKGFGGEAWASTFMDSDRSTGVIL